jgi:hypothetical protein
MRVSLAEPIVLKAMRSPSTLANWIGLDEVTVNLIFAA